jgi:hypothetical protein
MLLTTIELNIGAASHRIVLLRPRTRGLRAVTLVFFLVIVVGLASGRLQPGRIWQTIELFSPIHKQVPRKVDQEINVLLPV